MATKMIKFSTLKVYFAVSVWLTTAGYIASYCVMPKIFRNGRIIYEREDHDELKLAPERYVLRFRCSRGYVLLGRRLIQCRNTEWSERIPSCQKCPYPPNIPNGQYSLKKLKNGSPGIDTRAEYTCEEGYHLQRDEESTLTCAVNHQDQHIYWKGQMPRCLDTDTCTDPGVSPDGGRTGKCCSIGDVLKFSCKDNYNLVGENTLQCLPSRKWSSRRPLCRPQDDHCENPPEIFHGMLDGTKKGDYYLTYDEVEVICDPGFTYSGEELFVMCDEDRRWEADFKECLNLSKCGDGPQRLELLEPGRHTSGLAKETWPWVAGIYFKFQRALFLAECGASIIHQNFVLTAAGCLRGTGHEKTASGLMIKVGFTNVRILSNSYVYDAKQIFIHPLFNYETLNYNIALIQLKEPIKFNSFVRPICLPPEELPPESKLHKEGQNAVALGWGLNTKTYLRSQQLKEIIISLRSKEICNQSVLQYGMKEITDSILCGGNVEEDGGNLCTGDIGGPLAQIHSKSGRHYYWTQIGIISFGNKSCRGLSYFTNVQVFRPWITHTIKEAMGTSEEF